jgi:hypothetical protein
MKEGRPRSAFFFRHEVIMKNIVLTSSSLPEICVRALGERGFELLVFPEYFRLQKPVASHPDMLLHILGDKYITSAEYYSLASNTFAKLNSAGFMPVLTDERPFADYPDDVLFNSLRLGNKLFGLEKKMSKVIREYAKENSIQIVNVKQGYTKCSVCKVSENAVITADDGIAKAVSACGVDVLKIRAGHVRINGYDCGFIGGASGASEEAVYFCGDVMSHPDGKSISEFCEKHEKECISLSNDTLFDVGTLFFI